MARLRARLDQQGTDVHPADLDDALCLGAIASAASSSGETLLPFAVDGALLQSSTGVLWGMVQEQDGPRAVAVSLGAERREQAAQLDGFKSRALRATAPTQQHLYATEWSSIELASVAPTGGRKVLVVSDVEVELASCECLDSAMTREALLAKLDASMVVSTAAALPARRGEAARSSVSRGGSLARPGAVGHGAAADMGDSADAGCAAVWTVRVGGCACCGAWGLARSARVEALCCRCCALMHRAARPSHGVLHDWRSRRSCFVHRHAWCRVWRTRRRWASRAIQT